MKVRCHREGLLSAFGLVNVAVASRDLKPVLQNVKAIAGDDRLLLLATDLELGIRLEMRGIQLQEPGEALLPASRTLAILREATDDELLISTDAQKCMIQGVANEFEMTCEDPLEFPDVPTFQDEKYHEITAETLRDMIRKTVFAAAVENPRYAVTGVLWEMEGETVRLIATDGRRLAVCSGKGVSHGGHSTQGLTHVVPTKAMQLLERNLTDPSQRIKVCLRPNEALFMTDRATIYSRLVEGRYPPYREVYPKKPLVKLQLAVDKFLSAIKQAAIMTDDESKRVIFSFDQDKITMQAQGAKSGRSKIELAIEYSHKPIQIAFDPKFLTDMLRVLNSDDSLTLELTDGKTVGLFHSGENYDYIAMPLT